jgi:hypothetical protein
VFDEIRGKRVAKIHAFLMPAIVPWFAPPRRTRA